MGEKLAVPHSTTRLRDYRTEKLGLQRKNPSHFAALAYFHLF
jgi:hypothetical protein